MSPFGKGLVLAALQLAIVGSLGAKLLYDRQTRPRVWVETQPYDPELPIRGRYVSLSVVVEAPDIEPREESPGWEPVSVRLAVEGDRLVAHADPRPYAQTGRAVRFITRGERLVAILTDPVAFFIPEHVLDPSRRTGEERLWVEITLPKKGPPRPIRLAVKQGDVLTPLSLR